MLSNMGACRVVIWLHANADREMAAGYEGGKQGERVSLEVSIQCLRLNSCFKAKYMT